MHEQMDVAQSCGATHTENLQRDTRLTGSHLGGLGLGASVLLLKHDLVLLHIPPDCLDGTTPQTVLNTHTHSHLYTWCVHAHVHVHVHCSSAVVHD